MSYQGNNRDLTNYHVRWSPGSNANVKNTIFYFIFQLWLYLQASSMYTIYETKNKTKVHRFLIFPGFSSLKNIKFLETTSGLA